jgi:hypothetical protein
MADPELSLQSMLMVAAVIGRRKTAGYVGLVALFSVCAGLTFGTWIDGARWPAAGLASGLFLAVLLLTRAWMRLHPSAPPAN